MFALIFLATVSMIPGGLCCAFLSLTDSDASPGWRLIKAGAGLALSLGAFATVRLYV